MCRATALAAVKSGSVALGAPAVRAGSRVAELEAMLAGIEAQKVMERAKVLARVKRHRAKKRGAK